MHAEIFICQLFAWTNCMVYFCIIHQAGPSVCLWHCSFVFFIYWQHCLAQVPIFLITQRGEFGFFTLHRWHYAPVEVKFSMEDCIEFQPHRCRGGVWVQKKQKILQIYLNKISEYKHLTTAYPLHDNYKTFRVESFTWGQLFEFCGDLLKGF